MRCVAIRHDASVYIRGRIVTERTGMDEKRIRVGRALGIQIIQALGEDRIRAIDSGTYNLKKT